MEHNITTSESIDAIIVEIQNDPNAGSRVIRFPRFMPIPVFNITRSGQQWLLINLNEDNVMPQVAQLWDEIFDSPLNIRIGSGIRFIMMFNGLDDLKNALNRFLTIPIAGGGAKHKSKRRNKRNKKTVKNKRKRRHN